MSDGCVYSAHINEKDFVRDELSEYCFFFSYEKAFEFIQREKKSCLDDEDLKRVETFGKIYRLKADEVYGRYNPYDEFFFDNEMRLVDIWRYSIIKLPGLLIVNINRRHHSQQACPITSIMRNYPIIIFPKWRSYRRNRKY